MVIGFRSAPTTRRREIVLTPEEKHNSVSVTKMKCINIDY